MDELYMEMLELSSKGYYCSQVIIKIILELEEKENSDLIRAMGGLIGGLGFNQKSVELLQVVFVLWDILHQRVKMTK